MNKLLIILLFLVGACKKEQLTSYSESCRTLWDMSAGTEFNMETGKMTNKSMPSAFIVKCCELADGANNPKEQSADEGTCMAELLVQSTPKL